MLRTCLALLLCVTWTAAANAGKTESAVGRRIENFSLHDYRGKEYALADFSGRKGVVVAFLGTECPLARLYAPRLAALDKKYAEKGIAFVAINSNRQDAVTEIAAHARTHGIEFPVLKDVGNKVADQFGATRTPEVFLLDADRVVRYHGQIDDQYGVGTARHEPTREHLALAIDQLLAGQPIEVAKTDAVGCLIGRVREPSADSEVTYSNQIARILQNRCVECHREGEVAPFAMTEYDEVAGWADTIAEVVRDNRMPPWHANPEHGSFSNARMLPDEEKNLLYAWAAAGAPQGDPKQLPEPREYVTGWQLPREPDLVVNMRDEPYDVPAEGTVRYQYFIADPGFKEDKWVKVSELIPGCRPVVHHILVFVRSPEELAAAGGGGGGGRGRGLGNEGGMGFLAAYVPGFRPQPFPEGMAKRIPAGSKLIFQVHYTPNGTPQKDMSKLGLIFADPAEITHVVKTVEAIQPKFEIPPHADNHRVDADSSPYEYDLQLLSMSPHMHLRGKAFSYEARYPDGTSEILLDVPRYDFNWQTTYLLDQIKPLPKGTVIHCVARYDNSKENPANPDPEKAVRWGDQTWEEMMIGFYDVALKIDPKDLEAGTIPDIQPSAEWVAQRLLERFDKNNDGKVLQSELPLQAQFFFLRLDKNHDGELTLSEIAEMIREQQKPKPAKPKQAGSDKKPAADSTKKDEPAR